MEEKRKGKQTIGWSEEKRKKGKRPSREKERRRNERRRTNEPKNNKNIETNNETELEKDGDDDYDRGALSSFGSLVVAFWFHRIDIHQGNGQAGRIEGLTDTGQRTRHPKVRRQAKTIKQ